MRFFCFFVFCLLVCFFFVVAGSTIEYAKPISLVPPHISAFLVIKNAIHFAMFFSRIAIRNLATHVTYFLFCGDN